MSEPQEKASTEILENLSDTIENPVLPALSPEIKCAAFVNQKGEFLIAHEMPLPSRVLWAEFDRPLNKFSLVHQEGRIQDLGIDLTKDMLNCLFPGKAIQIAHVVDKKVKSAQRATLIIREF